MNETDFAHFAVAVAECFWGEPNKQLTTKLTAVWGSQGSRKLDIKAGTWFDHECQRGGGVIDLVMTEKDCTKADAVAWLESEDFIEKREREQPQRSAPLPAPPPQPEPERSEPPPQNGRRKIVATYDYTSRDGELLYQVTRWQVQMPDGSFQRTKDGKGTWKTFLQRRPSGLPDGSWVWGLSEGDFMRPGPGKDWRGFDQEIYDNWSNAEHRWFASELYHTIYRHPAVEIAIAEGRPVYLVEGEKDADTLASWGVCATTNSGGAKHWTPELAQLFAGADVVILVDNDETGVAAGAMKARSLRGIAQRIRVLNLVDHVPGFRAKGDVTDWRDDHGGTIEQFEQIVQNVPDWKPEPPVSKFGAKMVRSIAGKRVAYDWLVKGMIERGGVFVVAGEQQAGKSFFMIDLGMKIARGIDYCRKKVRQGLVIHHAGEDYRGVLMRVEGYRRHHQLDAHDLAYVVTGEDSAAGTRKLNLMNDDSVDAYIAECLEWESYYGLKLVLLSLDTLSAAAEDLDEINSAEVGKVLARINRIASTLKCTVCIVHHLNAKADRVRGSTKLTANVSQVIEVRQMVKFQQNRNLPPEQVKDAAGRIVRKATLTKNKNGENRISWRFVLRQVLLDKDEDDFQLTTCVCDEPSSDVSEGEARPSRLAGDQKLVLDALTAAIEDEGVDMPSGIRVGKAVRRAVKQAAFVSRVRKVWSFKAPEAETEARNRELAAALKRNVTALINANYMGRDNDHKLVWSLGKDARPRQVTKAAEPPPPLPADVLAEMREGEPLF